MKKIYIFILLCLSVAAAMAQDIIVTKSAERIEAKVTEITETQILYKQASKIDGQTYTIEATKVASVIFENGEVYIPTDAQTPTSTPTLKQSTETTASSPQKSNKVPYIAGATIEEKNNKYYYGGYVMSEKAYEEFLKDNCEEAYRKYRQGDALVGLGASCLLGTLAGLGATWLVYKYNNNEYEQGNISIETLENRTVVPMIFTLVCFAGWMPFGIAGVSCEGKSIKMFNERCSGVKKPTVAHLSVGAGPTGVGLSLNF